MIPAQSLVHWAEYRSVVLRRADDYLAPHYHPCEDVREWLDGRTVAAAWQSCDRADWMLWAAACIGVDRRIGVRAACACARTSLHLVPAGEDQPRIAIETAEAWSRGEVTIERVRAAWSYAAAYAAAYAAFTAADWAAVWSAAAVVAATDDAWSGAYAAYAASAAASISSSKTSKASARPKALAEMAELVRGIITLDDIAAALGRTP